MICVFKCKSCGDKMRYSITHQALFCNTCGSTCEVENYDIDSVTYEGTTISDKELDALSCPNCGANVIVKEGSAKVKCTYCGSEMAAFGIRDGEFSPEKIIPCQLNEDEARAKLITWWFKHGKSMPKLDMDKLQMKFQDIYVPVWLYDSSAITNMTIEYKPYSSMMDENLKASSFMSKIYSSKFKMVPFDSSCHIYDNQFHNIEPYDYGKIENFNPAYLSGHQAERYHFTPLETLPRVLERMKHFALEQTKTLMDVAIGSGEIVNVPYSKANIIPDEIQYVLVPLWIAQYTYKGEKKSIYINGQTGKVDGEVLIDENRYVKNMYLYGVTAVLASLFGGVLMGEVALMFNVAFFPIFIFIAFAMLVYFRFYKKHSYTKDEAFELTEMDKINIRNKGGLGYKDRLSLNIILIIVFGIISFVFKDIIVFGNNMSGRGGFIFACCIGCGLIYATLMIMSFAMKRTEVEQYRNSSNFLTYIKMTDVFEINPDKDAELLRKIDEKNTL